MHDQHEQQGIAACETIDLIECRRIAQAVMNEIRFSIAFGQFGQIHCAKCVAEFIPVKVDFRQRVSTENDSLDA